MAQLRAVKRRMANGYQNPLFIEGSHAWWPDDAANYLSVGSYTYVGTAVLRNSVAAQVRADVRACKHACSNIQCHVHMQLMAWTDEGFSPPVDFDYSTLGTWTRAGQVLLPGRSGFNRNSTGVYRNNMRAT